MYLVLLNASVEFMKKWLLNLSSYDGVFCLIEQFQWLLSMLMEGTGEICQL